MAAGQGMAKCAHQGCACGVGKAQTRCGPHCAAAAAEPRIGDLERCRCGHADCKAAAQAAQP